jgi:hypothetical protein
MRNSAMPIPWTHRDSRPRSQAEQDEEESFNARHRLKISPHRSSDLARRLTHYQEMLTRMVEDPEFRERIIYQAESYWERKDRERKEARARRGGLYKKRVIREQERIQEGRRRHEQIFGKAPPPQPYFSHLDQAVEWEDKSWAWNDTPPPGPPPLEPRPFNQEEFDQEMEKLYREYHIENNTALRFAWADSLSRLALRRLQVS